MNKKKISVIYNDFEFNVWISISEIEDADWIVALHGLQSNREAYDVFFQNPKLEGFSKLSIDFIWFWDSDKHESFSYTLEDQANIISLIIDAFDIGSCHLIGHSFWWMVWTYLLNRSEERFLSFTNLEWNLVLEDCWESMNVFNQSYEEFKQNGYDAIKNKLSESNDINPKTRYKWVKIIPDYAFYRTSKTIVEYSKTSELLTWFENIKTKKVFVYGDKNNQKKIPLTNHIYTIEIKNAGHFMYLDNFEDFNEKVCSFILS